MAEKLLKSATVKRGKDCPVGLIRGSAAAFENKCYFVNKDDTEVRMYDVEAEDWSVLRNCPYKNATLTVINGLPTTAAGYTGEVSTAGYGFTNSLYSYSNRRWLEKFPALPMDPALGVDNKKKNIAVVHYGDNVFMIGGRTEEEQPQSRIDVLNTKTLEWSEVCEVPDRSSMPLAAVCGDELYVIDGYYDQSWGYSCFIDELMDPAKSPSSVWNKMPQAPSGHSTIGSLCGQLVAFGDGKGDDRKAIKAYDPNKGSWYQIGKLAIGRSKPLVAQLSEDKLIVVGGEKSWGADVVVTEIVTGVV